MLQKITIENLHLFTGSVLIFVGGLSWPTEGVVMMFSWCIFGAMYISMFDIGEANISTKTKQSAVHKFRVLAAYFGAILSVCLFVYYAYVLFV